MSEDHDPVHSGEAGVPQETQPTLRSEYYNRPAFWLILIGSLLVVWIGWAVLSSLRDVSDLKTANPDETALMKYRAEEARLKGRKPQRQQVWTPLAKISPYLIQAVLISEDDKFFQHEGFDWEGIKTAMERNMERKQFSRGGSTITQQLAKNLYLSPSKNPVRKIREAVLAVQMEKVLSKKRILELYLNVIEWGDGVYGIGAASRRYFSKSAAELSIEESIRLASVLPNPIRYSPIKDSNKRMNNSRQVLAERMCKRQLLDETMLAELRQRFKSQ
jgi:monofunctional biosynthetic peptidoglycan transglycosylase